MGIGACSLEGKQREMTRSESLLSSIRKEAMMGPEAGSKLAILSLEIAAEYEIAISQNLKLERIIHAAAKPD